VVSLYSLVFSVWFILWSGGGFNEISIGGMVLSSSVKKILRFALRVFLRVLLWIFFECVSVVSYHDPGIEVTRWFDQGGKCLPLILLPILLQRSLSFLSLKWCVWRWILCDGEYLFAL